MRFPQACSYLDSFINYELQIEQLKNSTSPLARFSNLLNILGAPHKDFKAIHIAGTKGKGSTCEFVAQILRASGFRVGLYTSPHLWNVRERIRILGRSRRKRRDLFSDMISEKDFCGLLEKFREMFEKAKVVPADRPTYFEVLTAAAFLYFAQEKVDYVVLETGLGGRLDATNAVTSLVCGITPISLEHTQILGKTLAKIAREKAAIIKDNCPVIVAPQKKEVLAVIQAQCRKMRATPVYIGKEVAWRQEAQTKTGQRILVKTAHGKYLFKTSLLGEHQCRNAAMAIALVESLPGIGNKLQKNHVAQSFEQVVLPGRFEIIRKNPFVILDVAHTPESITRVGETVKNIFPENKFTCVLGISNDKDKESVVRNILKFSDELILTKAQHPRAADFNLAQIRAMFPGKNIQKISTVSAALNLALTNAGKDDVILLTGSFFVVAEARKAVIS